MALVMPVLPPYMNDWGDYLTYLLLPTHITMECFHISQVITDHLPFTMNEVTIKPSSNEVLRSLKEEVNRYFCAIIDDPIYIMQEWSYLTTPFHPQLKQRALGKPVFMAPLIVYTDDTSGNRSKKFNKFDNWALLLAGLPKEDNSKMENIHLVSASNQVSALDMAAELVKDLKLLEEGVVMHHAGARQDVLVFAPVLCFICDNVRSSELTNHMGSSANKFCRICQVINLNVKNSLCDHCCACNFTAV